MRRKGDQRGFVLVAVFAIVGVSLLIATSVLSSVQVQAISGRISRDGGQARANAKSALEVVISELEGQRGAMLRGAMPTLEDQYVLYERGGRTVVARLLRSGPTRGIFEAESGKLDVNVASAEELSRTGLMHISMASAIVAARAERPGGVFSSLDELAEVPGITSEMIHGQVEERAEEMHRQVHERSGSAEGVERSSGRNARWADVLTVFAVEPGVQRDGRERLEPASRTQEEIEEALGRVTLAEPARKLAELVKKQGMNSMRELMGLMRSAEVPAEERGRVIDWFRRGPGDFDFGRLDINTASAEALVSLEGVTEEQARRMVALREKLTTEEREDVLWPVRIGAVTEEQYEAIVDRVTARCMTYRVVLMSGEVSGADLEGAMSSPTVQEAVVDLSGAEARIAYLRDVSQLSTALLMATSEGGREKAIEEATTDQGVAEAGEAGGAGDESQAEGAAAEDGQDRTGDGDGSEAGEDESRSEGVRKRIGRWTSRG